MKTAIRILLLTLLLAWICQASFAQVIGDYQSNAANFNWTDAGSWQSWSATGWVIATTYPGETSGTGKVTIRNGHTVTLNVSPANAIESLQVGETLSGTLQFDQSLARTLTVSNIVTIGSGGLFQSAPALSTGTITTHSLVVGGSIINDGILDFSAPAGAGGTTANASGAGITFTGAGNSTLNCQDAVRTNLRKSTGIVLDKDASSVLVFTPGGSFQVLSANSDGFLDIRKGTFRLIGTNTFSNPVFNSADYTIPVNGGFELSNDNATLTAQNGTLTNNGHLTISNGTLNAGTASDNSLVTVSGGVFSLTGGTVNVAGRFKLDDGSGILSSGTLNVATVGYSSLSEAAFHVTGPGALSVSGTALITLAHANTSGTPFNDLELISGSGVKTITGGTFQIGTAATTSSTTFRINSESSLNNLTVFNSNSNGSLIHDLTVNNLLTLNGSLLLNTENLLLGASAPAIAGTLGAGAGMVVAGSGAGGGGIRKYFTSTGSCVFPFGDATGYLPVTLSLTSGVLGAGAYAEVNTVDSKHPNNASSTDFLNRYWLVSTNNMTSPVLTITGTYAGSGITGTEANVAAAWYTGTKWEKGSVVNSAANTISLTGVSDLTLGFSGISNIPPTVTILNGATVNSCLGTAVQLNTAVTGDPVITYSWSPAAGLNSTVTANPTANPPATTTYTLTITDGNGITATDDIGISISPVPTANPPADQNYCDGSLTTPLPLTGTPSGVVFDLSGGAAVGLAGQTGITSIPAFTPNTGTAVMSITPRANGCTGTAVNYTVTVNPIPAVTATPALQTICSGTAPSIALTGNFGGIAFSWTVVQSGVSGATAGSGSVIAQTLTSLGAGGTATYTITPAANGCNGTPVTVTVTVSDTEKPVLSGCPSNLNVSTGAGQCNAVVSWTEPAATDNCTASGSMVWTKSHTPGSTFPVGTTAVTYSATDAAGNSSNPCSFTVTVSDTENPVVVCPSNSSVNNTVGFCYAAVSPGTATATDNCNPNPVVSGVRSDGLLLGSNYPVGVTTITWTATDGTNTSTCAQTITVNDVQVPTFTAPSAITVYTNSSCTATTDPAITGSVTGKSDNCTAAASLVVTYADGTSTPGACAGNYLFIRTWKVTDAAGNFTEKTQQIAVNDNVKPALTAPPAISLSCEQGVLPAVAGTATATDNCGGTVILTYSDSQVNGTCAGNYVLTRTWTAEDCSGNKTTATQLISVSDGTNPIASIPDKAATCPSTIPLAYANYSEFVANGGVATDNCGAVTVVLYDEVASGLDGKPGYCPDYITRTYRVTDACGNYTDVSQKVTVAGSCGCSPCTTGTNFHLADFLGQPTGSMTFSNQVRTGKCCDAKSNEDCISFNVRIDDDAVGIEILIDGATPSAQDWRIDCNSITMNNSTVCIPGGKFYLFTYCKPGANTNTFTFRSLPGVVSSNNITTRVECSGQISTSGIVSNPQWTSIWPGTAGQYNSYLSSTTVVNPTFLADENAPPLIKYQICGTIGSTLCNALGTDCDTISVFVKQAIAVELNTDPTVVCQNNIPSLVANISPAGATYTYDWYTGTGATGTLLYSGLNSYTPTTAGLYSIKVTDTQNGIPCSISIFNFEVIFDLTGASVFTPPSGNLTIECNNPNASQSIQDWLATARAQDENGNPLPVNNSFAGISQACGTDLLVTFSASDHCGNIGTAVGHILITDTQVPFWSTVAGSLNRTVACDDSAGLAEAQALAPVPEDLCDATLTPVKTTGLFTAGACAHSGTYTNTWLTTDDCSNTSVAFTQLITVTDGTPPVITCPAPASGTSDQNECFTVNLVLGTATATDNCSTPVITNNAPAQFPVGITTVTWTATDACGNIATCNQTVTIADNNQAPWITCPANFIQTALPGNCELTNVIINNPVYGDNCAVVALTWSIQNPDNTVRNSPAAGINSVSGETFKVGTSTVTYVAADASGHTASCTFTVWIKDWVKPEFTIGCPADISQNADAGLCTAAVTVTAPAVYDPCGEIVSISNSFNGTPNASGNYPPGTTVVTWTITDASGNTNTCPQNITITDAQAPVLTCPANVTQTALPNDCFLATVVVPPPTYTDNCAVVKLSWSMTGATTGSSPATGINFVSGQTLNVGLTNVTYTAADAAGNSVTCSFTVRINDQRIPQFTSCPASIIRDTDPGLCTAVVAAVPAPVVWDPCSEIVSVTNSFNGTADASGTYPSGVTTVTWTITDASGNNNTCTQIITINDTQLPTITCPANFTQTALAGDCALSNVIIGNPVTADNCGVVKQTWVMTGVTTLSSPLTGINSVSGQSFNVGVTTVTYTVADAAGNVASCPFNVWIKDLKKPVFSSDCPADVSVPADPGLCTAIVTVPVPPISDPCNESYTVVNSFNNTSNASGAYPIGDTAVLWTITDASGNIETCTQTITVTDLLPALSCPADILIQADTGKEYATNVAVALPTYSDNCPGLTLTWTMTGTTTGNSPAGGVNTVPTPNTFNVGITTITYTLTDSNSHIINCAFTVTVESKPDITCLADITQNTDAGLCTASLNPGMPVKNAGAEPITWTWSMTGATTASGTGAIGSYVFNKGLTTIAWLATNISGTDNCSHTVTITDAEKPSFTAPSLNVGYCVQDIYEALYNDGFEGTPTDLTTPRPDYFLFGVGSPMLNLSSVADNCTLSANPIAWTIDFADSRPNLSGTGQLSAYVPLIAPLTGIEFPLGTNHITYTVTDASGNSTVQSVDLVVTPRPDIIKIF